jgi:hypothetical protein
MVMLDKLFDLPAPPFDYEGALAVYRNRLPVREDVRLQGHLESIRYLDCDRDYARESAAELAEFEPDRAQDVCRLAAVSGGELLWPLLSSAAGALDPRLGSRQACEQHLQDCPYCRLLADDLRAEMFRQQHGLPPGETTLRNWLLDHYVRPSLEKISQQLLPSRDECLAEVAQVVQQTNMTPQARKHLLPGEISVARGAPLDLRTDATYFVAAGEESGHGVVLCAPTWYTKLLTPPQCLKWKTVPGQPYRLELQVLFGDMVLEEPSCRSPYSLSQQVRDRLPKDRSIVWTVYAGEKELVKGVFEILSGDAQQPLRDTWDDATPPTLVSQLAKIGKLWEFELYDASLQILRGLQRRSSQGAYGFLVNRMLAGFWSSVRDQLSERDMDQREGSWADEQAKAALRAASAALPLH